MAQTSVRNVNSWFQNDDWRRAASTDDDDDDDDDDDARLLRERTAHHRRARQTLLRGLRNADHSTHTHTHTSSEARSFCARGMSDAILPTSSTKHIITDATPTF